MNTTASTGYLAMPARGTGPGVLVLHPWWGLNRTIKGVCDRLAEEGFIAYAVDLYDGKVVETVAEAEQLARNIDQNLARKRISDGCNLLEEQVEYSGDGLAVIGFSLGAFFALELSGAEPERIRKVVVFYGTGIGEFEKAKASYLGHFADADDFEPLDEVRSLEQSIRDAGRSVQFHEYEGTGHWFFEPDRKDAFNPEAADLAWQRTLEFLKKKMVPRG